jgi:hypothetical protein
MYLNIDVIINLLMSTLLFIGIKAYIDDNNRNILYISLPPFLFWQMKPILRAYSINVLYNIFELINTNTFLFTIFIPPEHKYNVSL